MTESEWILVSNLQAIQSVRQILSDALPLSEQAAPVEEIRNLMRTLRGWQTKLECAVNEMMEEE